MGGMNVTHRPETRLTATLESLNVLPTEDSHMNSFLRLILAASAVATIALGADNTIGTWKYNTAKSKGAPGVPPVTNLTVTREATEGGVKITAKGERADGSKIDAVTDAKYDGKPVSTQGTGQAWDTTALKQMNADTVAEERTKKGGKYHSNVRFVVSKDGKTMMATAEGTDADGKKFSTRVVWDKQ